MNQAADTDFQTLLNQYYDAVVRNDQIMQELLLHTREKTGILDEWVRSFSVPNKALIDALPSPNRKLSPEERLLVIRLLSVAHNSGFIDYQSAEYLEKHFNALYKEILKQLRVNATESVSASKI